MDDRAPPARTLPPLRPRAHQPLVVPDKHEPDHQGAPGMKEGKMRSTSPITFARSPSHLQPEFREGPVKVRLRSSAGQDPAAHLLLLTSAQYLVHARTTTVMIPERKFSRAARTSPRPDSPCERGSSGRVGDLLRDLVRHADSHHQSQGKGHQSARPDGEAEQQTKPSTIRLLFVSLPLLLSILLWRSQNESARLRTKSAVPVEATTCLPISRPVMFPTSLNPRAAASNPVNVEHVPAGGAASARERVELTSLVTPWTAGGADPSEEADRPVCHILV